MSTYAIFNRSQRSERGSLCVGQALRSADIEALVWPVAPQCPQMLATLEAPHLDCIIIPTTGQEESIWAALE